MPRATAGIHQLGLKIFSNNEFPNSYRIMKIGETYLAII